MTFGGVEQLLRGWLKDARGGVRAVTETPSDLAAQVPLNRITRIGGSSYPGVPTLIFPRVAVASFAAGEQLAIDEAEAVLKAFLELLPNTTIQGSTVTGVTVVSGPVWVPYPDTVLRQRTTTFDLVINTIP